MPQKQSCRLYKSPWAAPLPYSIWKIFEPYRAQRPLGHTGYFLTPDQVQCVLGEIMENVGVETSEVDLTEIVTPLLRLQSLQSEQERAEELLKKFRICRSGSSSALGSWTHV